MLTLSVFASQVDLLLRKGADPRLQNSQFMTPYDLSENDECARILSRFEKKLPPKRLAVLMQSAAVIKSKAKKIREKRKEKERARKNEDKYVYAVDYDSFNRVSTSFTRVSSLSLSLSCFLSFSPSFVLSNAHLRISLSLYLPFHFSLYL